MTAVSNNTHKTWRVLNSFWSLCQIFFASLVISFKRRLNWQRSSLTTIGAHLKKTNFSEPKVRGGAKNIICVVPQFQKYGACPLSTVWSTPTANDKPCKSSIVGLASQNLGSCQHKKMPHCMLSTLIYSRHKKTHMHETARKAHVTQ